MNELLQIEALGSTESPGSGGCILVVDDDPDFCQGLCEVLESEGYDVVSALSFADALTATTWFPADVAILDFNLGAETGLDLIAPLKEALPDIVPILSTASTDLDTVVDSLRSGVFDYLVKPLRIEELLLTLNRCFLLLKSNRDRLAAEQQLTEAKKYQKPFCSYPVEFHITSTIYLRSCEVDWSC